MSVNHQNKRGPATNWNKKKSGCKLFRSNKTGAVKQQKPVETGEYGECVDPKHVLHLDSNGRGKKNVLQIKMQYVQTLLAYYLN